MSMYLINEIATICLLKRQWKSSKNYSGKVVKIAGNNCNFGSHWLLAVNHCNQCSDWLQVVNDCQNCSYYLQLSAVKNHMQWITTIQNRVQSFNCTFTALSLHFHCKGLQCNKRVASNEEHVGRKIVLEIIGVWTCLLEIQEYTAN